MLRIIIEHKEYSLNFEAASRYQTFDFNHPEIEKAISKEVSQHYAGSFVRGIELIKDKT